MGKLNPQVEAGLRKITHCIIDIVIKKGGRVPIKYIEGWTGLQDVSNNITADILVWMSKDGIINIVGSDITGDVGKLAKILEQAKTDLPGNHGKPWSENDYITLAELKLMEYSTDIVAKKMGRTAHSISEQVTILHKAFRLIPIISKYKTVREFVSKPVSPNPKK